MRPALAGMLAAFLLAGLGPAEAEIRVVEGVGRAIATGVAGAAELRRRALEEALYEAAMAGGAQVQGYSAVVGPELVAERMVVRPASRILDYTILSEERLGDVLEIRLRAHVGDLSATPDCSGRPAVEIAAWTPRIAVAPDAPAWLQPVAQRAAEHLLDVLGAHPDIRLRDMKSPSPPGAARLAAEFDYAALVGTGHRRQLPPDHLALDSTITLRRVQQAGRSWLELELASILTRPDGSVSAQARTLERAALPRQTPWEMLDRLATRDRAQIAQALMQGLPAHAEALIKAEACQPLAAPLAAGPDGTFLLPFGRRHGISRNHLAYTEGAQTPYTLLEIIDVTDRQATLRPIDQGRNKADLVGALARFAEPGK